MNSVFLHLYDAEFFYYNVTIIETKHFDAHETDFDFAFIICCHLTDERSHKSKLNLISWFGRLLLKY